MSRRTTCAPRRTRWVRTESIARSAWARGAAPESTAHDWATESILHSSFWAEPRGVPSSKDPRRYHSPSHARSRLAARRLASCRYRSARARSPRCSHRGANDVSTMWRNQPSQVLSPRPWGPTRFMPSFQSPLPMRGRPCGPDVIPLSIARTQCSKREADSDATRGWR